MDRPARRVPPLRQECLVQVAEDLAESGMKLVADIIGGACASGGTLVDVPLANVISNSTARAPAGHHSRVLQECRAPCPTEMSDRSAHLRWRGLGSSAALSARDGRSILLVAARIAGIALAVAAGNTPGGSMAAELSVAPPSCLELGLVACPQPFDRELPPARDMLSWDQAHRVIGFRNSYRLYRGDVFHANGAAAQELPPAATPLPAIHYLMDGTTFTLEDYLEHQSVTGLLILKNGRILYEHYGHGNTDRTLWTSRSVAKSVVSVLVGMAIREGLIRSLDASVIEYVPELRGSAWTDVHIRQLLQHTSGVAWNEEYGDPRSDFATLTRCEAAAQPYPCIMRLLKSLHRRPGIAPGAAWSYNTAGAWLLGLVLERAAHTTLAHFLETRLWSRVPMEADGVWQALVPGKVDMGGHGFNATLRDWGRFALFVENGGHLPNGQVLVPDDWLTQSVTWTKARGSVTPSSPDGQFGYQWWYSGVDVNRPDPEGANDTARETFWALGLYGQAIAIDRAQHLVLVQWSVWEHAESPPSLYDEQVLFFGAVARAVREAR